MSDIHLVLVRISLVALTCAEAYNFLGELNLQSSRSHCLTFVGSSCWWCLPC